MRTISSTGSPLSPEGFSYIYENVKKDVHLASISGGTDIVSCFVLGIPTEPVIPAPADGLVNAALTGDPPPANPPLPPPRPDHGPPAAPSPGTPEPGVPPPPNPSPAN